MTDSARRTQQAPAGVPAPLRRLPIPSRTPRHPRLPWTAGDGGRTTPTTQGTLALAMGAVDHTAVDPVFGPQPTATEDLPDAERWAAGFAQAVVEVLAGSRPVAQLSRWTTTDVFGALQRRATLAARTRGGETTPARPAVVRSVRTCQPADGVTEVAAVILDRGRVRAVAIRAQGLDGRWRATAVEVG